MSPALDQDLGLEQRIEDLSIEKLGADRLFYRRRGTDHSAAGTHFRSRSAGGEVLS
jgi:hypothetical protein